MSKLTRRHLLVGLAALAACAGCDEPGGGEPSGGQPTPSPSPVWRTVTLKELGISLPALLAPSATPTRYTVSSRPGGGDDHPVHGLGPARVYALPDDFVASPQRPINGHHGLYRGVDQLVDGHRLDWDDGPLITYGVHRYVEYTNTSTDYDDFHAFVRFARPLRPGCHGLTILWPRVRPGEQPEQELRRMATGARVIG